MPSNRPNELPAVQQSLVVRTGLALAGVILATMVVIIGSALTAESVSGDAATINIAGSLRMQAFRIANTLLLKDRAELEAEVTEFDDRLNSPLLRSILSRNVRIELKELYQQIVLQWERDLKPEVLNQYYVHRHEHQYLKQVDAFVDDIDLMVKLLEEGSESKIKLLRVIQFISLGLTVLVVFITLFNLQTNVVNPLKDLVINARRIMEGQFDARVSYDGDDELGLLSSSFNQMAENLSTLYSGLEGLVEEKVEELQLSNKSLRLLYDSSRRLNEDYQQIQPVITSVLQELQRTVGLQAVTLRLVNERGGVRQHLRIAEGGRIDSHEPEGSHESDDSESLATERVLAEKTASGHSQRIYPVRKTLHDYGELCVEFSVGQLINEGQEQLIQAVCDVIANGLSMQNQYQQETHLMLMEERTTIARELHDSLAQALSYQKLQVSRLSKAIASQASSQVLDEIVKDIREGLNSAYRQLRELLTTFRLQLDAPGLEPALAATIEEFGKRSVINFHYDYGLGEMQFTANEEIHCLQIVREAISNIVRHSSGANAWLRLCGQQDGGIEVSIEDDGIGLSEHPQKVNHYGLAIMQERASSLNGHLVLGNSASGGAKVTLRFTPLSQQV